MDSISGLLVTVRTAKQGSEMVCSKHGEKYQEEISTLRLNADDLATIGVENGNQALLASGYGTIRVICKAAEVPQGLFFLPLGAVANTLFSGWSTEESGVPNWKRLEVVLSPCREQSANSDSGQGGGS